MKTVPYMTDVYQVYQEIGTGGTGTVFLAYHTRLEKLVVLKQLKNSTQTLLPQRNEVDILKNLHHRNLPQVYDFLEDDGKLYTVIDYIEGQTLAEYISEGVRCTQKQICLWLEQMADVLNYLHSQTPPILHCDIKPENIIITPKGDAVLIDFGVSLEGGYDNLMGISPDYASPEQIELAREIIWNLPERIELDGRSDIYSLAATFYHLMTGVPVSQGGGARLTDHGLEYSEGLTNLLDAMLWPDRQYRPESAAKLLRSIRRLNRLDTGYWIVLLCRCLSILISALLVAGGVYSFVAASKAKVSEEYSAACREMYSASDRGDIRRAEDLAEQILNNKRYQELLQTRSEDRAELLAMLGELEYAEGNYFAAASYYDQAALCESSQSGSYLRNEIAALAEAGELDRAQTLLDGDRSGELTQSDRLFAGVILAAKRGDGDKCMELAQDLLNTGGSAELCAGASLAAASISPDPETEIGWLETAERYSNSRTAVRGLAAAYMRIAMETSGREAENAIAKALDYYGQLNSGLYVSKTDAINYAIALRAAGEPAQAAARLESLKEQYPEDYRVVMQLAFCYYEAGDNSSAGVCCRKALELWSADMSPDREDEDSDSIQDLLALAERFGIQPEKQGG